MLAIFEAIAVTLWLTTDTIFYLFNFSYIGLSISLGLFLFAKKIPYARRIVQLTELNAFFAWNVKTYVRKKRYINELKKQKGEIQNEQYN